MSTDPLAPDDREPYIRASLEILACAIARLRGKATTTDLNHELEAIDGDPDPIATMAGWRGAAEVFAPVPPGHTYAIAAVNPTTGQHVSLDKLPMGKRLSVRMEAALANKDYDTARALWVVATDHKVQAEVLLFVLMRAAQVIEPCTRLGGAE